MVMPHCMDLKCGCGAKAPMVCNDTASYVISCYSCGIWVKAQNKTDCATMWRAVQTAPQLQARIGALAGVLRTVEGLVETAQQWVRDGDPTLTLQDLGVMRDLIRVVLAKAGMEEGP
mgnify:CR=1 FL=1